MSHAPAQVSLALGHSAAQMLLGSAWGVGNKLMAFPSTRSKTTSSSKSSSTLLSEVTWETTLYDPIFRKLVNESSQAFFALQKLAQDDEVIGNSHLVRISRQYRSIIKDCQELLCKQAQNDEGDERALGLMQQSELLYKLELIWNLVEILCIEKQTAGIILPQLLQWISFHFPLADEMTRRVLEDVPEHPESHPEYWDALTLFLIQGNREHAQNLLRLHSGFVAQQHQQGDAFASLDELIRKMPIFNPQMSVVDFNFRWKHWQGEVVARLGEGDFSSFPELSFLASLMAGSEEAFAQLVSKCETWYQWMAAKLLFTCPDVKAYDLAFHAEKAINQFGGLQKMTSLDSMLLATMETDISQLMNELCTSLDNFWFPSHLLDLLHHADQLDNLLDPASVDEGSTSIQPGPGLREFLLLDYATCLMSHQSLWQLGALYLDCCPTQGRYRLEALLERTPLNSERKANKVISMASQRGMSGVVASACKVMGMRALKADRVGTAMAWALRSQDIHFTTFLADSLLQQYCEKGSFSSSDLLDHLGSSMVVSDRLTFLAKYREFHKLCQQSDFRAGANLLHSLMWSRLAPKYFWVTLLVDAIPFLSAGNGEVMLSSEQTYEIMHCLQELTKETTLPKKQKLLLEEHEPQIRMHLAQNLALALMDEGDIITRH